MALLEKPQLDIEFSNGTMGDMKDAYLWVDDEIKLKQVGEVLSKERVFGVDTEQHSLRSFLGFTSLIQVGHVFLILYEVLALALSRRRCFNACLYFLEFRFLQ